MRKIFTIVFVFISFSVHAQQTPFKPDSLLREIQNSKDDTNKVLLYERLFYSNNNAQLFYGNSENLDEKLIYATKMLALSQRLYYKKGIADGYNCIGIVYSNKKGFASTAIDNFYSAITLYKETGDQHGLGGALANIGIVHHRNYRDKQALEMLLAAKKILEAIHDSTYLACTLSAIGNIYFSEKKYTEAIESFQTAKAVYFRDGDQKFLAAIFLEIAWTYTKQKKYSDAILFANKSLDIAIKLPDEEIITSANSCLEYANKRMQVHVR